MLKRINLKEISVDKVFLWGILLIFAFFGSYLILRIKPDIGPDEEYHIKVSEFYSETFGIPNNSPDSYPYRDITRIPYLSFWINARLINLNFIGVQDYIILRFFNLLTSLGSLIVIFLISKEIIRKKLLSVLPVFLLSNTLMFVFLSSVISYDNLSNFFIFLSIYFFIKYLNKRNSSSILYIAIFQILALLTKFSISPVVLATDLLLLSILKKREIIMVARDIFYRHRYLVITTSVLFLLGTMLYGGNLIKYGELQVKCDSVLTHEQCMHSGLYVRAENTKREAFHTIEEFKHIMKSRLTPIEYLFDWVMTMFQRIYGIVGSKWLLMNPYLVNIYLTIFVFLALIVFKKWKSGDLLESSLLAISLFYIFILLIYQNYRNYFFTGFFDRALQGRYIFPVLPLLYIVFTKYLLKLRSRLLRVFLITILITLFTFGCIPYFLLFVSNSWFI